MLKIKVKAGSITNLTDARYFAAREVEWLGFPIGTGEGMIEPVKVKAIAEWVDGVKIVGEFNFTIPEEIISLSQQVGFDAVQVGMFISLEDIAKLKELSVIKEVVAGIELSETELEDHLDAYANYCDFFLLNFSAVGHSWNDAEKGHPYTIDFLKNLCKKYSIILNLDCKKEEVARMINEINPYALGVSGGEEERVGVKSFDDLDEILDELEIG
jgi:phosphoribosylanthranilate isomerase